MLSLGGADEAGSPADGVAQQCFAAFHMFGCKGREETDADDALAESDFSRRASRCGVTDEKLFWTFWSPEARPWTPHLEGFQLLDEIDCEPVGDFVLVLLVGDFVPVGDFIPLLLDQLGVREGLVPGVSGDPGGSLNIDESRSASGAWVEAEDVIDIKSLGKHSWSLAFSFPGALPNWVVISFLLTSTKGNFRRPFDSGLISRPRHVRTKAKAASERFGLWQGLSKEGLWVPRKISSFIAWGLLSSGWYGKRPQIKTYKRTPSDHTSVVRV